MYDLTPNYYHERILLYFRKVDCYYNIICIQTILLLIFVTMIAQSCIIKYYYTGMLYNDNKFHI